MRFAEKLILHRHPEDAADGGGDGHGEGAPEEDAAGSGPHVGSPDIGGEAAEDGEEEEGYADDGPDEGGGGTQKGGGERHGGAGGEGHSGSEGGLQGAGGHVWHDAEFLAGVNGEGVLGHELFGHLAGEGGIEAALDVDIGELGEFARRVGAQFGGLAGEIGVFGIGLGTDGDVFPSGHGHGSGGETGEARDEDFRAPDTGRGNADDEAGGGDKAVIRPQDGGAKPADAVGAVSFAVRTDRHVTERSVAERRSGGDGSFGWAKEGGIFASVAMSLFAEAGEAALTWGGMSDPLAHKSSQELAERLSLALSAAEMGDWTWDRATDEVILSERVREIFGVPPGANPTRSEMRTMLSEDDQVRTRRAMEDAVKRKGAYEIDYQLRRSDGVVRSLISKGQCLLSPDGEVTGMVGVVQDVTEQVELARQLRDARERLEATLIAAEIGTWSWDIVSNVVTADANLAKIFFSDPKRTQGPVEDFVQQMHPEDRPRVEELIEKSMTTGIIDMDYRLVQPDGSVRWVIARGRVERDAEGKPVRLPGVIIDITEHKRQENEIRQARRKLDEQSRIFDTVLSVTDDFAYIFDLQGRFTFANRPLLELWGKTLPEIVGKTCLELGYPDWHAAMHMREIETVIATKKPIKAEVPYTAPTGIFGVYEYIFKPVLAEDGSVTAVAGTTRDVTDRKRDEAEMQRQHQVLQLLAEEKSLTEVLTALLRMVQEQAGDGMLAEIMILDNEGKLHHGAGPSMPKGFIQAITGTPIGPEVGSCGSAAWFGKPVYVTDIETDPLWKDFRGLAKEYNLRACWSCPILSSAEQVLGTFAMYYTEIREPQEKDHRIIETVTRTAGIAIERKQSEQALRRSRDEAEAANHAKDRFLAVLSHELRTPLTPVLMLVAARQRDPNLPPDLRADMAMIRRNLDLETTLIDDMLDLSRIMSGKLRLRFETATVNAVVSEACAICRPQIEEKAIKLECEWGENLGAIQADAARLQQVFWNVLKNAAKFTPEGGFIHVRTSAQGKGVEIRIEDSGVGIQPEALPKIFDAFEQGESKAGGLGLGLAISKALVELHGGTIRAESAGPGRGSVFVIELPVTDLEREDVRQASPQELQVKGAPRLLVVEDHADTAFVLCRLLEDSGYTVRHAGSLAEARALVKAEPFDVLISDIGLPDGTGYELMTELHNTGLPGIAMSGYGMDEDIRKSKAAGFLEHLVKPVDVAALQRTVQKALQGGK